MKSKSTEVELVTRLQTVATQQALAVAVKDWELAKEWDTRKKSILLESGQFGIDGMGIFRKTYLHALRSGQQYGVFLCY